MPVDPPQSPAGPPSRRAVRAARGGGPSLLRRAGVPVLLLGCAAAVLLAPLTLPGRGEAAASTTPGPTQTRSGAGSPSAPPPSARPRRTTTAPAADDGTRVSLTLRSRPRSSTDQELAFVGRRTGTVVLDDPARPDGDAVRRSTAFDVGRGALVLTWRPRSGWVLESLSCTTTDGNVATTVGAAVTVVTIGRGEVRCTAVVARR